MNSNIAIFTGKTFVGHIGMFVAPGSEPQFPIGPEWRHDLFEPEEAVRQMLLEIVRSGVDWPSGFHHAYVSKMSDGHMDLDIYDCACDTHREDDPKS